MYGEIMTLKGHYFYLFMALLDFFKKDGKKEALRRKEIIKEEKAKKEIRERKAKEKQPTDGKKEQKSQFLTPVVTEKGTLLGQQGAYSFRIPTQFNKIMVKEEIRRVYKVFPRKIRIVNTKAKKRMSRGGHFGIKPGFKKAMVYLNKGDKIE
jgi:ribosomal protein L23